MGSIDIVTDIFICSLPFYVVLSLKIDRHAKIAILVGFAFRGLVVVAAMLRIYYLYHQFTYPEVLNITWTSTTTTILTSVEVCFAIVTACIPFLKPFFDGFEPRKDKSGSDPNQNVGEIRSPPMKHLEMKDLEHLEMKDLEHVEMKDLEHLEMKDLEHLDMKDLEHNRKSRDIEDCLQSAHDSTRMSQDPRPANAQVDIIEFLKLPPDHHVNQALCRKSQPVAPLLKKSISGSNSVPSLPHPRKMRSLYLSAFCEILDPKIKNHHFEASRCPPALVVRPSTSDRIAVHKSTEVVLTPKEDEDKDKIQGKEGKRGWSRFSSMRSSRSSSMARTTHSCRFSKT